MTTVQQILKAKSNNRVSSVRPNDTVYRALESMAERNIGALLVIDDDRICGIVTERDYARKVVLQKRSSHETRVEDIMTSGVLYTTPTDEVEGCMALMTEKRIRHLPVIDNGELVGMISMGDIVKAVISEKDFLIDQLSRYITGTAYADEPQPVAQPAPRIDPQTPTAPERRTE